MVRSAAAEALGELRAKKATPNLMALLQDQSLRVCEEVIQSLGELGGLDAVTELVDIALRGHHNLRWRAVESLKLIDISSASSRFIEALKDEDCEVRKKAAEALGKFKSELVIEVLVEALEDGEIVWEAAESLKRIINSEAIPRLVDKLDSTYPPTVQAAVNILGELGDQKIVDKLIALLDNWDFRVRKEVIEALGNLGAKATIPILLKFLHGHKGEKQKFGYDRDLYKTTVIALGKLGCNTVIDKLLLMLDEVAFGRSYYWKEWPQIFDALEKLCSKESVPALLSTLKSTEPMVGYYAAQTLGRLRDARAVSGLIEAFNHKDSTVLFSSVRALKELSDLDNDIVQKLCQNLEDANDRVLEATVFALGELRGKSVAKEILKMLDHSNDRVRYKAADALGEIGCPTALTKLWERQLFFGEKTIWAIAAIQSQCGFYNYELFTGKIPKGRTIQVFLVNALEDESLYKKLNEHLTSLKEQKLIFTRHDSDISPGEDRNKALDTYLNTADIILLLVSASLLKSHEHEIQQAMERHIANEAKVIPIFLRPVAYEGLSFSELPKLPPNGKFVALWEDQDEAFLKIAEGIKEAALEVRRIKNNG